MRIISMNTGWRYAHLGRGDWREITLPHDAMLSEERTEDSAGGTNTGFFAACDYEYEKTLPRRRTPRILRSRACITGQR